MSDKVQLTSSGAPNGIDEYHWEHTDSVVAVPQEVAVQLLRIPGGGYAVVEAYKALPVPSAPPAFAQKAEAPAKKAPGRPKKAAASPEEDKPSLVAALGLVENKAG